MQLHINPPLINSRPLSQAAGRNVWLKMDALQPSGSFKIHGVGLTCQEYYQQGARSFISSSGGKCRSGCCLCRLHAWNSCHSCHAGNHLKASNRFATLLTGQSHCSWHEANQFSCTMVGGADDFIRPFDDHLLRKGYATMIDEVAATGICPDAVVLSVGGSGLMCGLIERLERNGLGDVPVIAVETEGAASFHAAANICQSVDIETIDTVATSLEAKRVCDKAVEYSLFQLVVSERVTEESAIWACLLFDDDHKVMTEPAHGAALSCFYEGKAILDSFSNILVIVCGGATTPPEQLVLMSTRLDIKGA